MTTSSLKERRIHLFEERVFALLNINQQQFNSCVEEHGGYALLLRNWIKEAYIQRLTSLEIATTIRKSPLALSSIKNSKPLSLKSRKNNTKNRYIKNYLKP
ncbi:hypothetical protein [Aquimarina longa]|uniref:hypothetical protein n=1 Tax=Aquimarina longa TaxID=1080221 RepID=UPI000786460F|nr:hypothetical protein [Aquimarina longa]